MGTKYHAAVKGTKPGMGGTPLCGANGIDRYKTVTVSASEWNHTIRPDQRCERCLAAIRRMKSISQ